MARWSELVLLLIVFNSVSATGWELVFPQKYPDKEDLELLSIGAKVGENAPNAYLIGSHSGFAILGVDGDSDNDSATWSPVKLPVPFDITTTDVVDGQWIIGGSRGRIAIHQQPDASSTDLSDLTQYWTLHELDEHAEVVDLESVGDSILALLNSSEDERSLQLFRSMDAGNTWEAVPENTTVVSMQALNGVFYVLNGEDNVGIWMEVSDDGTDFRKIWGIEAEEGIVGGRLDLIDEIVDEQGNATGSGNRLYVRGSISYDYSWSSRDTPPSLTNYKFVTKTFRLSSLDGIEWYDHGSTERVRYSSGTAVDEWNPLELADSNRFRDWPALLNVDNGYSEGQVAGNYAVSSILWHFNGIDKTTVFRGDDLPYPHLDRASINWADGLVFSYVRSNPPTTFPLPPGHQFILQDTHVINPDGVISSLDLVVDDKDLGGIQQVINSGGTAYFRMGTIDSAPANRILSTRDLLEWEELTVPDEWTSWAGPVLVDSEPNPSIFANETLYEWSKADASWYPLFEHDEELHQLVYVDDAGTWFRVGNRDGFLSLEKLDEAGQFETIGTAQTSMRADRQWTLNCPDGRTLISFRKIKYSNYNSTCEMIIFNANGNARISNPSLLFPPHKQYIEAIDFVNGWFYIMGGATIRTRDFVEFEPVVLPNDEPLTHLRSFAGKLYGFSTDAVYRKPLEKGYLDSYENKQGWRYADWLGWFQVIDEEKGAIHHLCLNDCWVKPIGADDVWIQTENLGWIFMRKDWSPWFWRMQDECWYWLDQSAWPSRVWNSVTDQWVELVPK